MADYNMVAVVKVMPTDPEVNLDELEAKLKEALPEKFGLAKVEREPIAFGLVALKFYVLAKDERATTSTRFLKLSGTSRTSRAPRSRPFRGFEFSSLLFFVVTFSQNLAKIFLEVGLNFVDGKHYTK